MLDEIVLAFSAQLTSQSTQKQKRTKISVSITIGGLFFITNIVKDVIDKEVQTDTILVLLGVSVFLGLFTYIILALCKPNNKIQ